MTERLGIGTVGAGAVFEEHARALHELRERVRHVAVCDIDAAKRHAAAARHGVAVACRSHTELVARADVDIVSVCTPPSFHEEVVVEALRAGKYVVCEKPLAHTLEAADRIIEVARDFPGRLSVVYQFRYLPAVRRTVWLRDTGALGGLLYGRFHRFARFRRPGRADRADWWGRWDIAGGGSVMTQLIHELDLMCYLFGAPTQAFGIVDTLRESIESEDASAAVVRFENGAICSCQSTMSAHRSTAGFDVIGTLGSAHSPWAFECLDRDRRTEYRAAALELAPDGPVGSPASAHTPHLAAVLDAIEAGRPLPSGPLEARASLELATAIYASGLSQEQAKLPIAPTDRCYRGITSEDYAARALGNQAVTSGS
jgi:predicted dehydrogenase